MKRRRRSRRRRRRRGRRLQSNVSESTSMPSSSSGVAKMVARGATMTKTTREKMMKVGTQQERTQTKSPSWKKVMAMAAVVTTGASGRTNPPR